MTNIEQIKQIAHRAGDLILEIYNDEHAVEYKQDKSPLTAADLASHAEICRSLAELTPDVPVLSEESPEDVARARMDWNCYWLVDPLDGTKEFIKRNGEFTVNIALIDDGVPVLGVVHAPALGVTYWGQAGAGAFKQVKGGEPTAIHCRPHPGGPFPWRVVGSRSHGSEALDSFMASISNAELLPMGSSLKLCLVAEGVADIYPRLGPTSEWDTAAAQAVVEAAGGSVLTYPQLVPLRYNQRPETLLNPHFIACHGPHPAWSNPSLDSTDTSLVYAPRDNESKAEVVWHLTQVTPEMRAKQLNQRPRCIWLTGLSGAGKSTIANALELALHQAGHATFLLDGDNIRHGLNKDLSMSDDDRAENIRRVGEVARLMVDAGLLTITAFISPFRADRDSARALFAAGDFVEVHVDAPLHECERRDPKGLYRKAREGKIRDFTGIDSAYEPPTNAELHLNTANDDVQSCVTAILQFLQKAD